MIFNATYRGPKGKVLGIFHNDATVAFPSGTPVAVTKELADMLLAPNFRKKHVFDVEEVSETSLEEGERDEELLEALGGKHKEEVEAAATDLSVRKRRKTKKQRTTAQQALA